MKDFGVKLNDVKIDKYTQDHRVQKMKIWTHFTEILLEYRSGNEERDMVAVIDVCLSQFSIHLL